MRRLAWTLIVLLAMSSIVHADCEGDVKNATMKLQTSGPFHFVIQEWNRNFLRQTAGRIIPETAMHTEAMMNNGWRGGETIYIGKQSWKNDGLGWVGPWLSIWSNESVMPTTDFKFVEGSCSVSDGPEGSRTKEYNFNDTADALIDPALSAVRLLVDIDSGHIVRYEKLRSSKIGINVIATYRHDETIRIEPPNVDMVRRKANALAAFNNEVELTDQACRDIVMKLLQAGREGLPFTYKIDGGMWAGVSGMHGTFVPPHSLHNIVEGVPYHGGGSEYIVLGNDAWTKAASRDWERTTNASPLSEAVSASWAGSLFFDDFLIGSRSHIGRARCPSPEEKAGAQVDFYEYDLYRDTIEGRFRVATQRLYTGPDGARPVKLETIGAQGRVTQVQTRTYMLGLVIKPPTTADK